MFQMLSNKVVVGMLTLGMFLFSSFEGNDASFSKPSLSYNNQSYILQTKLENAFENSFEEVLKSGEEIFIDFEIKLEENFFLHNTTSFYHSLKYNTMERTYSVNISELNQDYEVGSYEELLDVLSVIEFVIEKQQLNPRYLTLTASIRNIKLPTIDEKYDLMMLWNFQKPKLKINLMEYKNEN